MNNDHLVYVNYGWYSKIRKFDCRIIDVGWQEGGGGYFTVLPVSPLEYRKRNPTKASVQIIEQPYGYVTFLIVDDWGDQHSVRIHKSLDAEIKLATKIARDENLLLEFSELSKQGGQKG